MRTEKLPDPKIIGTAGSFFKNPLTSKNHFFTLKSRISGLRAYPPEQLKYQDESAWLEKTDAVKVPAGRLLDELGWRGRKIGNVGTFHNHALTLITYPGATGPEVYEFAQSMRADVLKNFDIDLEYEVVII
jgi:UDP-N-acetylmuramate dehydrogenase